MSRVVFLCLLLIGCVTPALAQSTSYEIRVLRVVDADTLEVEALIWPKLTAQVIVRLAGVNAPESRGPLISECELKAGRTAKEFTQHFVADGAPITLTLTGQDKYGRMLGRVRVGKNDLAAALLAAGHARPYAGERRKPWC